MVNYKSIAEKLAGSHYYCEDTWYSCPLAIEGCADESKTECDCGYPQRVENIEKELEKAYNDGYNNAFRSVTMRY